MGFLFSKINFQLSAAACLSVTAVITFFIPHIKTASVLLATFCINQVPLGMFQAGANMFLLHLWGKQVTPFMQTLYFAYGIGAILAPIIVIPFLTVTDEDDAVHHSHDDVHLFWPYTMVAGATLVCAIAYFVTWRLYPTTDKHPSRVQQQQQDRTVTEVTGILTEKQKETWKLVVVSLAVIMAHAYMGMEITMGSYLSPFAVKSRLHLSKATGAHLVTLYWTAFTLFRIATVMYIDYIGNELNILGSLTIVLCSNAFLVPFGDSSVPMLWTGVALMGIGLSSMWACLFGFLEERFTVTSTMTSVMITSGLLGEFVFPLINSSLIDGYPVILLWIVLFCSLTITILFIMIALICRWKLAQKKSQ